MLFSTDSLTQTLQNGAKQLKSAQTQAELLTRQSLAQAETWVELNKKLGYQMLDLGLQASATALNFTVDQSLKACESFSKTMDQVQTVTGKSLVTEELISQGKNIWGDAFKPAQEVFSQMMGVTPKAWVDLLSPLTSTLSTLTNANTETESKSESEDTDIYASSSDVDMSEHSEVIEPDGECTL